jgi:hypothetical protein
VEPPREAVAGEFPETPFCRSCFFRRVRSARLRSSVRSRNAEEIAITRNSSESIEIAQLGIDLKAGDESSPPNTGTRITPGVFATLTELDYFASTVYRN